MKDKVSEFEVQALAYWRLKEQYRNVRGEYKINKTSTRRGCRLDIAVFSDDGNILFAVEVKKSPYGHSTSQGQRYEELIDAPCYYVRGMEEADRIVEIVQQKGV